jgi:predicted phosphodiesterase
MELIIIPDVHGRTFWKDIKNVVDTKIVFLGDYLDPYTSIEGITPDEAIDNFNEIIEFTKKNIDRVVLLYGNHDSYAFKSKEMCSCRHDWKNLKKIERIFEENKNLFKLAYDIEINGNRFLLTHAGINPFWVNKHKDILGDNFNYTADELNSIKNENLINILCDISEYRGGYDLAGSPVWTDIHEHIIDIKNLHLNINTNVPNNLIQVVGHTWIQKPIFVNCGLYDLYCLDTQEIYYISENGEIRKFKDDTLIENKKQ